MSDLVAFLHKVTFSPVPSTWINAVDAGYFTTWAGLSCDIICKHFPKSMATTKGHLKSTSQHIRYIRKQKKLENSIQPQSTHHVMMPLSGSNQQSLPETDASRRQNIHRPNRSFYHHLKQCYKIHNGLS